MDADAAKAAWAEKEAMRLAHLDICIEWERVMSKQTHPFKDPASAAYAAGLDFASSRLFKRASESPAVS